MILSELSSEMSQVKYMQYARIPSLFYSFSKSNFFYQVVPFLTSVQLGESLILCVWPKCVLSVGHLLLYSVTRKRVALYFGIRRGAELSVKHDVVFKSLGGYTGSSIDRRILIIFLF